MEYDVAASLKGLDTLLGEHELNRKIQDILKTIIAGAEAGSEENAARVLHLAMDCTAWLEKRIAAEDPLVLKLAKAVPAWPVLVHPPLKVVLLPPTLGVEYEALDLVKLARQKSVPREVAWRLLRLVDLIRKSNEAKLYEKDLEKVLGELQILNVFGNEVKSAFEIKMQAELESWKLDENRCRDALQKATDNLVDFLGVGEASYDNDAFAECMREFLPPKEAPNAVGQWWTVAKTLFLTFTDDHPERCKVLKDVAKSKARAYLVEFPGKNKGAASRQKAGIVREVGQAFKAVFRVPDDGAS